jgi:hypothetical protein
MTFFRIYFAVTSVVTALPITMFQHGDPLWPAMTLGFISLVFAGAAALV